MCTYISIFKHVHIKTYGIFWFGAIFFINSYKVEKLWCVGLERNFDYLEKAGNGCSLGSAFGQESSPRGQVCVSCLSAAWGRGGPAVLAAPSDPSTGQISLSLVRRHILPSTKLRCLELAPSLWELKVTLNSPFFLSAAWELGRRPAGWFSRWETGWGLGNPSALVKEPDRSLAGNSI